MILFLERSFSHHILRRLIDADVDTPNVFTDESEQKHNHATDKEYGGEHAGISNWNCRIHEFLVDDKEACGKADGCTD